MASLRSDPPVPAPCAHDAAAQGENGLSSGRIQAIFASYGTTLGEYLFKSNAASNKMKNSCVIAIFHDPFIQ